MCGIRVHTVRIGALGAQIETDAAPPLTEAICAFAGPAAGFLAVMLKEKLPYVALAAVIQSAYNMIPVYPLDGGRLILSLLSCIFPMRLAMRISHWLSFCVISVFMVCGMWIAFRYKLGILPILFPAMPILLTIRKNSLHWKQKNSTIRERQF